MKARDSTMFKIFGVSVFLLFATAVGVIYLNKHKPEDSSHKHSHVTSVPLTQAYIDIMENQMVPASVTVKPHTTILWTNRDTKPHSIEISYAAPRNGEIEKSTSIAPGKTYTYSAKTSGSFLFKDTTTPNLGGQIIVIE
jgi:plastocyanin